MRVMLALCLVTACAGPTEPQKPLSCVIVAHQATVTVYASPIPGFPCVVPK